MKFYTGVWVADVITHANLVTGLGSLGIGGPFLSFPFLYCGVTVDAEAGMTVHSRR